MNVRKIFISYSHSDQDWARVFAQTLATSGIEVWFDEFNIKPGEPLVESLEKGLRESDAVVLVLNAENMRRPNIFFEIGAALGMNKPIIPVVPAGFESHKLPLPLQRIKFLIRNSPEKTAHALTSAVAVFDGEAA